MRTPDRLPIQMRIKEVEVEPGVVWFYPEQLIRYEEEKGFWLWKETLVSDRWELFFRITDGVAINQSDILLKEIRSEKVGVIAFQDLEAAQVWARGFKTKLERELEEREEFIKLQEVNKRNADLKIKGSTQLPNAIHEV